eukprot:4297353-Alexandrium_andersonii.AAC.1
MRGRTPPAPEPDALPPPAPTVRSNCGRGRPAAPSCAPALRIPDARLCTGCRTVVRRASCCHGPPGAR